MDIYVGVTANGCSTTWGWVDNLAIVPAIAVVEAVDDTPALGLTTAPAAGSITLDPATGEVTVAPGTTADSYVYTYEICEVLNPSNCDTAQVTVQVDAVPIVAVDDDFSGSPINTFEGGTAGSVPSNDTINGTAVATDGSQTTITLVDDGGIEGATISADGTITIPAGIPQGSYTSSYQLCESLNPENCDTATTLANAG